MTRLAPDAETRLSYLTAAALLHNLGEDPAAVEHWITLGKATGDVCRIRGCHEPTEALGMCPGHYKRHTRAVRNEAAQINHDHRQTYDRAKVRDVYAEEVADMLEHGSTPEAILRALDVTPANLARALFREKRGDLAAPFSRMDWQLRPRPYRAKTTSAA